MSFLNLASVIIGDFNTVLSSSKHKGGSYQYYSCKIHIFLDFIASNDHLDVKFTCSNYTWCNNHTNLARCWARLDLCFVNPVWSSRFDSYILDHLPRIFSDHLPLLLKLFLHYFHKSRVFRFDKFWLDYLDCHAVVHDVWHFQPHYIPMHGFSHLVARTKTNYFLVFFRFEFY